MDRDRAYWNAYYKKWRQDFVAESRESLEAIQAEHDHCFERPIRYEGAWQIIECSSCPERIMWHPVTLPPEPTTV